MTPTEIREILTDAIIDDIMENIYKDDNLGLIRDGLYDHLAQWSDDTIEGEYKARAIESSDDDIEGEE
jgi:hypothetical protein